MTPSNDATAFKNLVSKSKNIIAVAGAGLSAASGIPTFRGAGGYWKRYNAISLATPEAFSGNPSRVWQFYHMRRRVALESLPNAAHYALADLCIPERLHTIAPDANFTFITQNVDGLSVRALNEKLAQASAEAKPYPVYEMHGRVLDTLCTVCNRKEYNDTHPLCDALGKADEQDKLFPHLETDIPTDELPRCRCGGIQRPGVVWFGEKPLHLKEIDKVVAKADLCLVVGTSSTVYPAAGYASEVAANGGKVEVFNLERSDGDDEADFLFLGPCEKTLPSMLFDSL